MSFNNDDENVVLLSPDIQWLLSNAPIHRIWQSGERFDPVENM